MTTMADLLTPWDKVRGWFDPRHELAALQARNAAQGIKALKVKANRPHEALGPSRLREFASANYGPNSIAALSGPAGRTQARALVRNNDLARNIVRTAVNNMVGPSGIGIEPQPRKRDGSIHQKYAKDLREAFGEWAVRPEVSGRHSWSKAQRMMAWGWIRDGEAFSQDVIGFRPDYKYASRVPYALEMFESDMVPFGHNDADKRIVQGVELDAWGKPKKYWVHKTHPNESVSYADMGKLKAIEASLVRHLAFLDHIGQVRGITEFASIINRLVDIKDYEDSERIAAKVAAAMTAYVKRNAGPEGYQADQQTDENGRPQRQLHLSPGMIIDDLSPGEEIGMIDSNRPNPNVVTFREGQLRAAAGGFGYVSYSSLARNYNGTYSAQRQELVEQYAHYAVLCDDFTSAWVSPIYSVFVNVCHLSGVVPIPKDVNPLWADDALFAAQAMPWIDPLKEANAWETLVRSGFASEVEVLRKRGQNPRDFLAQSKQWRDEVAGHGLVFSSDAANDGANIARNTESGDW